MIGNIGCERRVRRGRPDGDEAAFFRRVNFKLAFQGIENPVAFAFAGAWPAHSGEAEDGIGHVDGPERAVEFGLIFEFQIIRDLGEQIGRLQSPHMGVDCGLIGFRRIGPPARGFRVREAAAGRLGYDREFRLTLIFWRQHHKRAISQGAEEPAKDHDLRQALFERSQHRRHFDIVRRSGGLCGHGSTRKKV